MSGVYIKGMDVPPNCWWCPVKFWNDSEYICPFSHKHINSGDADRHDDCPLLPVHDHGDLIDRDELMKHGVYLPRDGGYLPLVYMSYVKGAKTVIPAERNEASLCDNCDQRNDKGCCVCKYIKERREE